MGKDRHSQKPHDSIKLGMLSFGVHLWHTAHGYVSSERAVLPVDKQARLTFISKKRNVPPQWCRFPGMTGYFQKGLYYRHAAQHNLISFFFNGRSALTETGFQNWRKTADIFKTPV